MDISVAALGEIGLVKLRGRLDSHGVDEIELQFNASIVPRRKNTVVDLSEVNFITSMGLRMFIAAAKALTRQHAKMVLYGAQPGVCEVLAGARLADLLPVVADQEEALRSFGA